MNTQMYPFLRIAIVLVAGIMVGDMLYGHVPVIVVFGVLAVLVCATIVAYNRSNCKKLTTLPFARIYQPNRDFATAFICTSLNW